MIRILRWSENRFIPADKVEKHCLINVISPERSELEKLSGEMLIPSDFLTDPLILMRGQELKLKMAFFLLC